MNNSRSPLTITFSVWKALFLREAAFRLSTGRAAWLWLMLEPVFYIVILMSLYSAESISIIGGIDTAIWVMVGQGAFYMYSRTSIQAMNAINANQALFAYRQVKPVDTVLARAVLEGFLMIIIIIILCLGTSLLGVNAIPSNPLLALVALCGMWLVGLGVGLITSVLSELVPEVGKFMLLLNLPLHLMSGVMFNISVVPHPYYDWLTFNPLVHGLEATRLAFAPSYQVIPEFSISYPFIFAITCIFFGLALHNRFAARMVTQ